MIPGETYRQLLRLQKALRMIEAQLEANSSIFVHKVEERAAPWLG
jgi:hypothetical protein